MEVKSFF